MQCAYRLGRAGWYHPSSLRVRGLGFPRPGKVNSEKLRCYGLSMYLHTLYQVLILSGEGGGRVTFTECLPHVRYCTRTISFHPNKNTVSACKAGTIITVLQMRKWRVREVKQLAQNYTQLYCEAGIKTQVESPLIPMMLFHYTTLSFNTLFFWFQLDSRSELLFKFFLQGCYCAFISGQDLKYFILQIIHINY